MSRSLTGQSSDLLSRTPGSMSTFFHFYLADVNSLLLLGERLNDKLPGHLDVYCMTLTVQNISVHLPKANAISWVFERDAYVDT